MKRKLDQTLENYHDENLSNSFSWFRAFFSDKEWAERRSRVEDHVEYVLMSGYGFAEKKDDGEFLRMNFDKDKIVWYLYLVDTCLHDIACYESVAGARIISIFKCIGEYLDQVKEIEGINKKVRRLIKSDPIEADTVLFEILTALLWTRNGYQVAFVPELKSVKQPDLKAIKDGNQWFIECKRLSKSSDYAKIEKDKWLKMFTHIRPLLLPLDLVLEVTFHEEISTFKETFLFDLLKTKLKKRPKPGLLLTNSKVPKLASESGNTTSKSGACSKRNS